jgi:hypothetical protein
LLPGHYLLAFDKQNNLETLQSCCAVPANHISRITTVMEGQFPPPMAPYGVYNPYGQPPMIAPESMQPRLHHLQTMSNESLGGYRSEFEDITGSMLPPHAPAQQPSARSRRRATLGADHIKHRRTRSGCFTCRQRRVKVTSIVRRCWSNADGLSSATRHDRCVNVGPLLRH